MLFGFITAILCTVTVIVTISQEVSGKSKIICTNTETHAHSLFCVFVFFISCNSVNIQSINLHLCSACHETLANLITTVGLAVHLIGIVVMYGE